MLNISKNSINQHISMEDFNAYGLIQKKWIRPLSRWFFIGLLALILLILILPWTQNIESKGYVTTRTPGQRPQAIQSILSGRLEQWFVQEGDFVEAGDTIVFISEIKSDYFDPALIVRTEEQLAAKSQSIQSYEGKVDALGDQYEALRAGKQLKLEQTNNKILQAKNKISIDSIELVAHRTNLNIAENQLNRIQALHERGLKSLSELQEKELKLQETQAKVIAQENKLLIQRNEVLNLTIELSAIEREYADKLAKSRSDQQSAVSDKLESQAATSKLQNQLSNYNQRQQFYYITAPQAGYINKTIKKGVGEIIKEGTDIATVMPRQYDLAIESYVTPQDLPLLSLGNTVNLRFDGYPAVVISGWPAASTGVFSGTVVAMDQFINENGQYRILISPDESDRPWPDQLRVGAGVQAFMLLNNVPIWYELWRQLNGFPPDYYQKENKANNDIKRKAPLKTIK